ncbi:MAG: ATP-dependent DNA helicase RecQ [Chloroflexi bacterium]|nr:ATP-dependent DNA helicase RecQ [Chloroflexota bacterium]
MSRSDWSPEAALARWFPKKSFRDRQLDATRRLQAGHSALVLMPTGTGKSLIYQLPVLASEGVGLIVSPLIALMQQQGQILDGLGARVLPLGGADAQSAQASLRAFSWFDGPAFLFISPERLETDGYLEFLLRRNRSAITLVAIDEAHCISQWGHDFRPAYKAIPNFLDRAFGPGAWPQLLCLTATLDESSQAEIISDFRLCSEDVIRSKNMLRTNLELSFRTYDSSDEKKSALEELLDNHRAEKIIVYAHLKQNRQHGTRALSEHFQALGHRCAPFDADLPIEQKDQTVSDFKDGHVDVVFATGAFGMGVDIPDVRGVIHFLLPESLEQYYQEVGRAGRDGDPAFGILLYTAANARVRRDLIRRAARTDEQVREFWETVCTSGRATPRTISPWTEFQGKDDEHALFYALQRVGALTILARGPGRLQSFERSGPNGAEMLDQLNSATLTGNTTAAIRKLQLDPAETMEKLFALYHDGELKLVRSPDKTLLFEAHELLDEAVSKIVDDISEKIKKRLADFETFVSLIEAGVDPGETLSRRFGSC